MKEPARKTACPDANQLLGYATDRLDEVSQAEVEAHLDTCPDCMDLLVELVRFETDAERSPWPERDEELEAAQGALFGKYTLEAVVGQGAMGTVYAAHDKTLDRKVALKILRPHADDGSARARLTRESRAMARLSHPHVVTVYDAGEQGDRLYIAMELFSGSTLASWLRGEEGQERPQWKDAMELLLRAGEGLVAAHAAGLVHRDFKPENVLLGVASERPRRVVVTDFGLVAARQGEPAEAAEARGGETTETLIDEVALTRTGVIIGTPRYMSPEQFDGGVVDARSDQFSFAVTVYEAVYQQKPFAGRTMEELRRSVAKGDVAPPPGDTPVPTAVHRSLLRALAIDPSLRHPSLAALLRELGASLPAGARTTRARLLASGVVVALVALGSVLVSLRSSARGAGNPGGARDAGGDEQSAVAPAVASASSADPRRDTRTAVIVSPLDDRTGDPRLAAAIAQTLALDIDCSRSFDAYTVATVRELGEEIGAGADAGTDDGAPRRIGEAVVAAEGRHVFDLRGDVTGGADGALLLSLASTDLTSGAQRPWSLALPAGGANLAQSLAPLAASLRDAFGAPAAADPSPRLSPSLEALAAWSLGRDRFARRDWAGAIAADEKALAADPAFSIARADLGFALARDSRSLEATQALGGVIDHPDALCERQRLETFGLYFGLQARQAASSNSYQQYLSLWPGDLGVQTRVINTLLDDGERILALDTARSAVNDHPRAAPARTALVYALFMTGNFAEAAREGEALRATVSRPPEKVLFRLIASEALLGQDDAALAVMREQTTYDPEIRDEEEADLAMFRGRLEDAETILRRRIQLITREDDVTYARTEYLMLADVLLRRGDRAGARAAGKNALVNASAEATETMLYDLGRAFVAAGDDEDAQRVADVMTARTTLHARAYGRLLEGDRLRARGKRNEARAAYGDALHLEDTWQGHERLGELAVEHAAWDEAERELSICVARSGEGIGFIEPGLHYLTPMYTALARLRDGG